MPNTDAAPTFPDAVTFPDVDADILAREDGVQRKARAMLVGTGAWQEFMRKMLPPTTRQSQMRLLRVSQA